MTAAGADELPRDGPGAWHGADLKAAIGDVTSKAAFRRPTPGRHNITEIALHHAYCARAIRSQLSGRPAEPFVIAGEDWFALDDEKALSWRDVQATVEQEQLHLSDLIAAIEAGTAVSPLGADERVGLVLGITCHAVYHAGQVQLLKRLHEE